MMLPEYWCRQKLLVVVEGPQEVNGPRRASQTRVEKPFARIGSHESSEVVLSDPSVSGRSLYLHVLPQGVYCVDLACDGPTEKPQHGWLEPDQSLVIGPYLISARAIDDMPTDAQGKDPLQRGSASPPYPIMKISARKHELGYRRLVRRLTIVGRQRPSTIRLTSRSVSAVHCVLYWDASTLWAIDLLSGNGTRLEEDSIEAATLPLGSSLKFGRVTLSYVHLQEDRSPPQEPRQELAASAAEDDPPSVSQEENADDLMHRVLDQLIHVDSGNRKRRQVMWLFLAALAIGVTLIGGAILWTQIAAVLP